jgi:DNA polymerase III alpha subunit (gram-positive type)
MSRRKANGAAGPLEESFQPIEHCTHHILYFDTETTGVDVQTAELIELATIMEGFDERGGMVYRSSNVRRFRSHNPIPPEASAIHDITDEDVEGLPYFDEIDDDNEVIKPFNTCNMIVAHNLGKYDLPIMKRYYPGFSEVFPLDRQIDTLRLAQHFWPEIDSHAMKAMRYRFKFDKMAGRRLESHSALDDARMLGYFMQLVSQKFGLMGPFTLEWWKAMSHQSAQPVMVQKFPFGKHRGALVDNLVSEDPGYINWCLQQDFIKVEWPDLYHTLLIYTHRKPIERFSFARKQSQDNG